MIAILQHKDTTTAGVLYLPLEFGRGYRVEKEHEEEKIQVARIGLQQGLAIAQIMQLTGLSQIRIEEIQEELSAD